MNKHYEHHNGKRICITNLGWCVHYRCAKTKRELYYRFDKTEDLYKVFNADCHTVFLAKHNEWDKVHEFICKELTADRDENGFVIYSWDEKMGCVR